MKTWQKLVVLGVAVLSLAGCMSDKQDDGKIHVGMVQIVEHQALDDANRGFVDAVERSSIGSKVVFHQQNAQGDQANLKTIAQSFVSEPMDLIGAFSTPAAQAMANETQQIPIVGSAITDYVAAKLVVDNESPQTNVTGMSDAVSAVAQAKFIKMLLPTATRLGIIYNSGEINSQLQADAMIVEANALGFSVSTMTVTNVNDIQQVAMNLVDKVDVIYVPSDNVMASALPTLVGVTDEARIPVIGAASTMVDDGATAALSVDYYQLGYAAGEMAVQILTNQASVNTLSIGVQELPLSVVNKASMDRLGIVVPQALSEQIIWR